MSRPQRTHLGGGFLASGGWILVLALLGVAAVFSWSLSRWMASHGRAVGDGTTVASYGFRLDPCLVPRDTLIASGMPKDGLRALVDPERWAPSHLEQLSGRRYSKLLLGNDLVAGVQIAGESRAYPLRFLAWHEVVNDNLGGEPIAVTYHPISGSVVVFSRRVAGEALIFAVSGLLSNSSQVLYERRPEPVSESLWSQLEMRAVAGPAAAAGRTLDPLPVVVAPWGWWLQHHPNTTLLAPDPQLLADYRRDPYSSYFGSDLLRYPVAPLPPSTGPPLKTPVIAVAVGGGFQAFTAPFLTAGSVEGQRTLTLEGIDLQFHWRGRPTVVWLEQPSQPVVYSLLFAWYAAEGGRTTWHGLTNRP